MSPLEELKNRRTEVQIKVDNKEEGYSYMWEPGKFENRLFMIRDLVNEYFDTNQLPEVNQEEDPFFDPPEAILIGRAYWHLKSLGYLMENPMDLKILGNERGDVCGTISVDVVPTDKTGVPDEAPEDILPDEPEDLIGQRIDFKVLVKKAAGLPGDMCTNPFTTYSFYKDDDVYQTKICQGKVPNPVWDYNKHHTVERVTDEFIRYLKNDAVRFE